MSSLAYPFHVSQEAIEQRFKRRKFDGFLPVLNVPMLAFPALVVLAQDAFTIHDEGQPVLEAVYASWNRGGQVPQNNLEKARVVEHRPRFFNKPSLHVVSNNNRFKCCQ
jgi:hypothetical protein